MQSTKVAPVESDDGGNDAPSLTEQGFREGQNVTFMGGTNVNGSRVGSRDIGVTIDIPGGIMSLGGITGALLSGITGSYPKGTMMGITIKGDPGKIKYVTPQKYKALMKDNKAGTEFLDNFAKERSIVDDEGPKGISKDRRIDSKLIDDEKFMKSVADVEKGISRDDFDSFKDSTPQVDTSTDGPDDTYNPGTPSSSMGESNNNNDGDDTASSGETSQSGDTGFGGGYGATYKGSLITRNQPSKKKPKKMKRGGLASR